MGKTSFRIIIIWLIFAAINFELLVLDEAQLISIGLDTSAFFPISVFDLKFHASGLKYGLLFSVGLWLAMKYSHRLKWIHIWILGLFFIVTGNLMQGGIEQGFYDPFIQGRSQYFHDAQKIDDWFQWLANFTQIQDTLRVHSKSHPPFAVLLHYFILELGNGRLEVLAASFVFFSSLSVILFWQILKTIGVDIARRNQLSILFAVIPAINIYSCISLDAIILTSSLLIMLGIVQIYRYGIRIFSVVLLFSGLVLSNALSFGGLFFFLVIFVLGVREFVISRKIGLLVLLGIILVLGVFINELSGRFWGYSHYLGFINASKFENPNGFRAVAEPVNYILTRVENVGEIALFLSVGCLIVLFHPEHLKVKLNNFHSKWNAIFISGFFVLTAMFLTGAFRTGETARACLFFYPYVFLVFRKLETLMLSRLIYVAGAQTVLMQLFGNYFW